MQSSGSTAEIGSIKANISFILLLILHRKLSNSVLCTYRLCLKFNSEFYFIKEKFNFLREMSVVGSGEDCSDCWWLPTLLLHFVCFVARSVFQCQGTSGVQNVFLLKFDVGSLLRSYKSQPKMPITFPRGLISLNYFFL